MELETEPPKPRRVATRHWLARGCLGGLAVGVTLTFLWWLLLSKAWADCQVGTSLQGIRLLITSPLVLGSTWVAFGILDAVFGRYWPRAGAAIGLVAALVVAYLWFIWLLPQTDSEPFTRNQPGICPGLVPQWWPFWLPS
jgi:ferric-dicitrate binding protein FerR (iron transport regulator)